MAYYLKIPTREEIPASFVEFMKRVARLIELGDEGTTIESDDLLQTEDCYGGLADPARQVFMFWLCNGPGEPGDDDTPEWEFALTKSQIASIATGVLTQLDMWRCGHCNGPERYARENGYCQKCDDPSEALAAMDRVNP